MPGKRKDGHLVRTLRYEERRACHECSSGDEHEKNGEDGAHAGRKQPATTAKTALVVVVTRGKILLYVVEEVT